MLQIVLLASNLAATVYVWYNDTYNQLTNKNILHIIYGSLRYKT